MQFGGICITTRDVRGMAAFYQTLLQVEPFVEGSHYAFGNVAIYDPGDAPAPGNETVWLQCFTPDVDAEYARLLREIPGITIIAPPERKPWGAYSFWCADPDGNKIAVAEKA